LRAFGHESEIIMASADDEISRLSATITELSKLLSDSQRAVVLHESKLSQSQDILSENQRFIVETQSTINDGFVDVIGNQREIIKNQHAIIGNQNTIIAFLKMLVNAEE
jgi:hypothetical protein